MSAAVSSAGGNSLRWGVAAGMSPLELESGAHDAHEPTAPPRWNERNRLPLVAGVLVLLALLASFFVGRSSCAAGDHGVDVTAPEGSFADFNATRDWRGRPRSLSVASAAIASDHERCGEHGVRVLRAGGNAVDAAVATCLCQGLYNPMASGIGGGALILVRAPNGTGIAFDARETAPALAKENMFKGKGPEESLRGGKAVAVPMEILGLYEAHRAYGKQPWKSLFDEAIDLIADFLEEGLMPQRPVGILCKPRGGLCVNVNLNCRINFSHRFDAWFDEIKILVNGDFTFAFFFGVVSEDVNICTFGVVDFVSHLPTFDIVRCGMSIGFSPVSHGAGRCIAVSNKVSEFVNRPQR